MIMRPELIAIGIQLLPAVPDVSFGLIQFFLALFFAFFVPEWMGNRVDKKVDSIPVIGRINIAFKDKILRRIMKERYNPSLISRVICGYIITFILGGFLIILGLLL